jgi:hypothetical protein
MTNVIKTNGEFEPFSEDKIISSIKRAGVPKNIQNKALDHVKLGLYENIPTSEIYKNLNDFLEREASPIKAKYSLKKAIMSLGPTGYPFEDFVSDILKARGYVTQVRSILSGRCVSHEIDVIGEKDNEKIMVEAKFHNDPGIKTDVHVSLYTKSRFEDLKEKYNFNKAWIYTNTKITPDALSYALCVGMGVVSWSYPEEESLRDLVEQYKLYPITILPSLSNQQIQALLENHIVLVKDICKNKDSLDLLAVENEKKLSIFEEAQSICHF